MFEDIVIEPFSLFKGKEFARHAGIEFRIKHFRITEILIELPTVIHAIRIKAKEVFIFGGSNYSLDTVNGFLVEFFSSGKLMVDGFWLVRKFLGWH